MSEDLTAGSVDITGTVNRTQEERSVSAGRMNVSEYVEYGDES
jgi:hypothetical protein